MNIFFKHHRIGYRQNPFSALTRQEWGEIGFIPKTFRKMLFDSPRHVQLIGRIGAGKTSLLHRIEDELSHSKLSIIYEYIPEGRSKILSPLNAADLFLLDEAQRLNWWQRRKWLRQIGDPNQCRCIFTSHQDLSTYFVDYNLPLVTLNVDDIVSPSHYAEWLENRLQFFVIDPTQRVTISEDAVRFLYETFQTDMRSAEYFLYEVFEDLETAVVLTPHHLVDFLQKYPHRPTSDHH
ncbi:MAG: hypothetical protein AAF490_12345 [Chloroflexota bacterium]